MQREIVTRLMKVLNSTQKQLNSLAVGIQSPRKKFMYNIILLPHPAISVWGVHCWDRSGGVHTKPISINGTVSCNIRKAALGMGK